MSQLINISSSLRLILELVAHHGGLEVPDIRSLTLVSKQLQAVRTLLLSKRRRDAHCYYYESNEPGIDRLPRIDDVPKVYHGSCWSSLLSFRRTNNGSCHDKLYITYVDGKRNETWTTFYKSGNMKFSMTYKDNVFVGQFCGWYESGRMSSRGFFSGKDLNDEISVGRVGRIYAQNVTRWTEEGQVEDRETGFVDSFGRNAYDSFRFFG